MVLQRERARVLHIITRLVVGGAQENTILSVVGLRERGFGRVWLASGPQVGPEGTLLHDARRTLGEVIVVPHLVRQVSPLKDAIALAEILSLLLRLRPHVLHTHSAKAGILGRIAARIAGTPFVVHTIHGLPFHRAQSGALNWFAVLVERLAAVGTCRLIAVSEAMKKQAIAAGLGPERQFVVVRSCMDVEPFLASDGQRIEMRQKLGIPPDEFVIGVVARLFPLKGHEFILKLAPRILRKYPGTRFLIVGDGVLRGRIEDLAVQLGIREKTIFTGLLRPQEVAHAIAAMDLVVHASLREGLARVLPQALLCGKPVVSFNIDGADEVIVHGRTGFLTEVDDGEAFLAAVLQMMDNPVVARRMGAKGRALCEKLYDGREMISQLEHLYLSFFS